MTEPEAMRRATPRIRWILLATVGVWAITMLGAWELTRGDYYRTFPSPLWPWAFAIAGSWTAAAFATAGAAYGNPELEAVPLSDLRISAGEVDSTAAAGRIEALDGRWHAVIGAYGAFLTDIVEIAQLPLLADPTCPATDRFTTQLVTTEDARSDAVRDPRRVAHYAEAVAELERAWKLAVAHARRKGVTPFDPAEQQTILRARKLLDVALDEQGYPPERREAMHRAVTLLRAVLDIEDRAVSAIEHKVARLEIEPGSG